MFDQQNALGYILLDQALRNGKDAGILVNFYELPYLDVRITNDFDKLTSSIGKYTPRGGSAIFDAVSAAADHLKRASDLDRHPAVIFLISDGEDNASRWGEGKVIERLHSVGVRIYTFYLSKKDSPRGRKILQHLAEETGGRSFEIPISSKPVSVADECNVIRRDLDNWFRGTYSAPSRNNLIRIMAVAPEQTIRAPVMVTK